MRAAQQRARGDQRLGRHGGQLFSHRLGGGDRIVGHVPDHAHGLGIGRAQFVTRHAQRHGARQAHALRQQPGAARIRHQPDLAEGLDEAGTGRGNGDVTRHGHRCACARRDAVDRAHGGHAHRHQAPRGGVESLVDHRAGIGAEHDVVARAKVELRQIGAGAKRAAGTGQHQRADRLVGLDLVERSPQIAVHLAREAVERGGAVQRQDGDGAFVREKNGGLSRGAGRCSGHVACLLVHQFTINRLSGRLTSGGCHRWL